MGNFGGCKEFLVIFSPRSSPGGWQPTFRVGVRIPKNRKASETSSPFCAFAVQLRRAHPMSSTDCIQLLIAVIYAVTLVAIWRQVYVQNRMLKAQMLRDRFDMYWKTVEPISDQTLKQLAVYPDDYMDRRLYEDHYKNNPDALRKYVYMVQVYEYLAFTYGLKKYKLSDPLGYEWTERWASELLQETEFMEVHQYHKAYYPYFSAYIDGLSKSRSTTERDPRNLARHS